MRFAEREGRERKKAVKHLPSHFYRDVKIASSMIYITHDKGVTAAQKAPFV
jgi:hypothetical protein